MTDQTPDTIRALADRLERRADIEDVGEVRYPQTEDEDVPEVTWEEMREIVGLLREAASTLRALADQVQRAEDLGPHPHCPRCKGTGECDNAQFRCACRWSTSPLRADADHRATAPTGIRAKLDALAKSARTLHRIGGARLDAVGTEGCKATTETWPAPPSKDR